MFNTKLIVKTYPNATILDLKDDIPISVNFNVADIREPDKRTGAFSKTITLYGTKTNNKFFEHLYEVNIKTLNFNPNVKTQASILHNDIEVLRGDLQLTEVRKIWENGTENIEFDVTIYGNTASIFTTISDSKLEDLDLSTYNHTYNMTNQKNSWDTSIKVGGVDTAFALGTGYVYPLIDYGEANTQGGILWDVQNFRPAIYVKTYWDKIFSAAGKTYTSTFLNSTRFKSLVIPHNGDYLSNSPSTLANKQFYAGRLATSGTGTHSLSYVGSGWRSVNSFTNYLTHFGLQPDDDSTTPFNDAGGVYTPIGGVYTSNVQGYVNFQAVIKIQAKLNPPAGTVTIQASGIPIQWTILKKVNGGSTWAYIGGMTAPAPFGNNQLGTSYTTGQVNINLTWLPMNSGDQFRFVYEVCPAGLNQNIAFFDAGSLPITTASPAPSIDIQELPGSSIANFLSTNQVLDGQPLVINDAIPKDVKQRDFIMSIVKMFNLYIDVDKTNPDNYIIEPRETFYGSTVINWTNKLAANMPISIKPMGELNGKTYKWSYKPDTDYYNKLYQDEYGEVYGTKTKIITNDFLKNEQKTEVSFSATPISNYPPSGNNLIIPRIFTYNGTTIKPTKHNVRILYYGGVKSSGGNWTYTTSNNSVSQTTHPYVGMPDDPLTTLFTLEYGVLNKLYYLDASTVYTDNNLYNAYYSRMINEITDRDSKIVTMYLKLEPQDILAFDFRNLIFIQETYYIVNKIIDYNPVNESLTKVELLKVTTYPTFSPTYSNPSDFDPNLGGVGSEGYGMAQQNANESGGSGEGNFGQANNQMAGSNINSQSVGGVYTGSNISVSSESYNINIVSCDSVFVASGATGFTALNTVSAMVAGNTNNNTLIGCNGVEIRSGVSNFTGIYIQNRVVTSDDNGKVEIGGAASVNNMGFAQTTISTPPPNLITTAYTVYYFDASGAAGGATLPAAYLHIGKVFYLVKKDTTANAVTISTTAPDLIQGASTAVLTMPYESITVQSDGSNWFII